MTSADIATPLKGTVLVVDDEPALRFPISEVLRDAGVTVVEAESADDAMDCLRANGEIRVVFSDVRMPGTMDGIGLAEHIEATLDHVRVILTSGNVTTQTDPYRLIIAKPYDLYLVSAQILKTLASTNK